MHKNVASGFLASTPKFMTLSGFRERATMVRFDLTSLILFKSLTKIPDYNKILEYQQPSEFKDINPKVSANQFKIPKFAILPPFLSDWLFDIPPFLYAEELFFASFEKVKSTIGKNINMEVKRTTY